VHYNLVITPAAIFDIIEATTYYDNIQSELGNDFLEELQIAYEKISTNPQFYSFISKRKEIKFRDIKIYRFPYVVVFEVSGKTVTVFEVKNIYRKSRIDNI